MHILCIYQKTFILSLFKIDTSQTSRCFNGIVKQCLTMYFVFDMILSIAFKNKCLWSIFESALFRDKSGKMISHPCSSTFWYFDSKIDWFLIGSPALFYLHVSFLIRNLWSQWTLPVSFENFKKCYITILVAFSCDAKCFAIVTLIFSSSPFPSPHFCWKDCQKIVYQLLMIRYPGSVSKIGSIWLN